MKRRSDLYPPLGKDGGPCRVVDRILDNVTDARDRASLIEDVKNNRDLSNAQAKEIYPKVQKERGPSPFNPTVLTPHAQYRMDLRGVTVKDVQQSVLRFRKYIGALMESKKPDDRKKLDAMRGNPVVKWFDSEAGRYIVVSVGDGLNLVSVYPTQPDPTYPANGCGKTAEYRAPVQELSGYRTYPNEKSTKGINDSSGDSVEHSPGESPKSDRERAKPQRTDTKENLERHTPGNAVYNTPGPSEPGQKIHVRSPGTPGEEYGHPFKENIYPRRTAKGMYPSYEERQKGQEGEARRYYTRYYSRNKGKIRSRAKRRYLKNRKSEKFKREKTRRNSVKNGWRFNRLPSGGYRSNADRARDNRTKKKADLLLPFYYPDFGEGVVLDLRDSEVVVRSSDGEDFSIPFFAFIQDVEFDSEEGIDAFFDLADSEFGTEEVRTADFYRETFRPGDNLDPGDGAQDLGEPSPVSPTLPYYDTNHNDRAPAEEMNNIGPTDNNPGSAKVIPEGHDFENRKATGSDLVTQIRRLVPSLAKAAQKEYDAWDQDEDGVDEEFGTGGICDRIAEAFSEVLSRLPNVEIVEGGQDGDDHAYVIALTDTEAVAVDIPPRVYETGGGYSWKKRQGVRFDSSDVVLDPLDRGDFEGSRIAAPVETIDPKWVAGVRAWVKKTFALKPRYDSLDDLIDHLRTLKDKELNLFWEHLFYRKGLLPRGVGYEDSIIEGLRLKVAKELKEVKGYLIEALDRVESIRDAMTPGTYRYEMDQESGGSWTILNFYTNKDPNDPFRAALKAEQETAEVWVGRVEETLSGKLLRAITAFLTRYADGIPFEAEDIPLEYNLGRLKVIFDPFKGYGYGDLKDPDPRDVKEYLSPLDHAKSMLERKGFGDLWYGNVYIRCPDCGGENPNGKKFGVGAVYDPAHDHVEVFSKPSRYIAELMVHELGHRYYFKVMNAGDRARFDSYFGEVAAVSEYGSKATHEDFAEVFMNFVTGRDMTRDQIERFKEFLAGKDRGRFASSVRVAAKMAEILEGLDPAIRTRSESLAPKLKRSDVEKVSYTFAVPGSKGENYTVKVKGVPSKNVRTIGKMDLRLSCSCDFWQYQGPEHWASTGDYLYGKPRGTASKPEAKDPNGVNRVCKHTLSVLDVIAKWPAFGKR